jgi:hypothetical protein
VPTVTGTATFSGCVGLGVTSGTAAFTAALSNPANCDTVFPNFTESVIIGTVVITWNTGQTSTLRGEFPAFNDVVTGGLFTGATVNEEIGSFGPVGACQPNPGSTFTFRQPGPLTFTLPAGTAVCASGQPCSTTRARSASVQYPGLKVVVSGTPSNGSATVDLDVGSGTLACPNVPAKPRPIATVRDSFAPSDRLIIIATLPSAASTAAEQVCFNSTAPFLSGSSPKVPKAGTGFLLACSQVANVAPCVLSSKQVGINVVVKFVIAGGDPRFYIALPKGRQVWLSQYANGKVGTAYSAQLQTSGGIAPIHWSVASGNLPGGCTLNAKTGSITGKPTTKGKFTAVVKATDAERTPQTASISVPITIT